MALVYRKIGGRKMEKVIAVNDGVQYALEVRAFQIGVRAEQNLLNHRQDGHARIDIEEGDVDLYVVLNDERGMDAAMSIEFGRAGYIDPETGLVKGQMDPLYILTDAARLPRTKGNRAPAIKPYDANQARRAFLKRKKKRAKKKKGGTA